MALKVVPQEVIDNDKKWAEQRRAARIAAEKHADQIAANVKARRNK